MTTGVGEYYDRNFRAEWERLDIPLCNIEFASTWRLMKKYFPSTGMVYDIGSGPGRYSIELLKHGYRVTLFDLSIDELGLAKERISALGFKAEAYVVGDARDLSQLTSHACDAALFLGPMYHITDSKDRIRSLIELKRVLKPGGVAVVAYLNSWGLIRTGITDFPRRYENLENLKAMLGENVFPPGVLSGFTECFWSTPPAAKEELTIAGFEIVDYSGAEGFASGMGAELAKLKESNFEAFQNVVEVAAETSTLPQFRDVTDHIHYVVRK